MQKSSKKKTLRENAKYPHLQKNLTTKRRQDYVDNIEYINGVVDEKGNKVMRALSSEEKEFLNRFNKEYYSASFEEDDSKNLFKDKVDSVTLSSIKNDIDKIRKDINTSKNTAKLKSLYEELESAIDYLREIHPRKQCTDANNARNRCLLNLGKSTNDVEFVGWDDSLKLVDPHNLELMYILNNIEELNYSNDSDENLDILVEELSAYLAKY